MKYCLVVLLVCLLLCPSPQTFGQSQADETGQPAVSVSPNAKKKAAQEAEAKSAAADKAKKEAEKKAARAKAEAEKQAKKEARLKAEAEQKAKEAAEKTAAAEAKAKVEAEAKAIKEAKLKAEQELNAKKEAKQKAAREAKLKAEAEQKAKEAAEKQAEAAAKARVEAEKKAEQAAEQKARDDVEAGEKTASAARAAARQKTAEADKAAQVSKKIASDKKSSVAAKSKAQEEAVAKEVLAKDAATTAAAKEAEAKQAREAFETSRQAKIQARQKAEAEAKAKKEAEKKAAIEAKIKAQEEAREIKAETRAVGGELGEPVTGGWWKRNFERAAKPEEAGKWKFSAGALLRSIHSQSFKTYSYSESYDIPAKAGDVFRRYTPAGDLNSYSDRNYDNGYVHKDDYTDLDGGTEDWDGGEIQGNSVVFHFVGRTYTEYTRSKASTVGETHNNSDREIAPYIQLERVLYRLRWFDAGLHLDFSRVTFSDEAQYANFSDKQAWQTYVQYDEDVYSLAGAPVINNIPDARRGAGTVKTGDYTYNAYNDIQQSLDMNLGTMSLGMLMSANYWRLSLSGIAGPTFNWVNMQASYTETLSASLNNGAPETLQTWSDSQDYSEYKFGGFVQVQLGLRIIDGFGVGIFGRYDWMENMSGNIGQSRYMINPEGGSLGATANLSF